MNRITVLLAVALTCGVASAPVALLVGATRDVSCTVLMAVGGILAGLLFTSLTHSSVHRDRHEHATAAVA